MVQAKTQPSLSLRRIWPVPRLGVPASLIAGGLLYFLMALFFVLQPKCQFEDRRKYFLCKYEQEGRFVSEFLEVDGRDHTQSA